MNGNKNPKPIDESKFMLQLFVSGMTPNSMEAIENVKKLCDNYLKDAVELEIIDLYKNPEAAAAHQIVFSPSLIKTFPLPKKVIIGTFHDTERVIRALGIIIED